MARMSFGFDVPVAPQRAFDAMIDFTERRPDLWPALSRRYYRVHELGTNWAEVTEGSDMMGGIWARERYDWSPDNLTVTSVILDSNIFKEGGRAEMTIKPTPAGSHIDFVRDRKGKGKGLVGSLMMAIAGRRYLTNYLTNAYRDMPDD